MMAWNVRYEVEKTYTKARPWRIAAYRMFGDKGYLGVYATFADEFKARSRAKELNDGIARHNAEARAKASARQ